MERFNFETGNEIAFTGMHMQGAIAIGAMLSLIENAAGVEETVSFDRLFAYILVSCGVVAIAVVVGHRGLYLGVKNTTGTARLPVSN